MDFHKTGMYFVNVILTILAVCLLMTSFILDRKIHMIESIVNETPIKITSLVLYILGCAYLFLIFSVGCIGTSSENGGLLYTYSFAILFLVLIQVSLACFAVFHIEHIAEGSIIELKRQYFHSTPMFHMMEKNLECCGLSGPSDYYLNLFPPSCCSAQADSDKVCTADNVHKTGCMKTIVDFLHDVTDITTVVCLVNGVLCIIAALYVGFFAEKLKLQERNVERRPFPIM